MSERITYEIEDEIKTILDSTNPWERGNFDTVTIPYNDLVGWLDSLDGIMCRLEEAEEDYGKLRVEFEEKHDEVKELERKLDESDTLLFNIQEEVERMEERIRELESILEAENIR